MINFEKHIDEIAHAYCGATQCERCLVGKNNCVAYKMKSQSGIMDNELCRKTFKNWAIENDYGDNPSGNGTTGFYLTLKQKDGYKLALRADKEKTEIHASHMETGRTARFPISEILAKEIVIRITDRFPELYKELGLKMLEKAGYKTIEHKKREDVISNLAKMWEKP